VKIGPIKWEKLDWSFDKLLDRAYMMVYEDGKIVWIFRHCALDPRSQTSRNPRIWSKLPYFCYEILKFHINHRALIHVHYIVSFEVTSQRFINDNILVEQGCASIKKQTFSWFS
jgi:hypothetical protein